jgi:hypothetical protein
MRTCTRLQSDVRGEGGEESVRRPGARELSAREKEKVEKSERGERGRGRGTPLATAVLSDTALT